MPLGAHVPDERQDAGRKVRRRLGEERIDFPFENLTPLPERMATLEQDRPELVHERLARCHQTRAGPVQGLQIEPVLAPHMDFVKQCYAEGRFLVSGPKDPRTGGIVIATVLSFAFGLAMLSRWRAVRALARVYVEIWRGTSEVVQLMWIYFVLPVLVGYQIVPLAAGIAVLGLNFGAYGAEIVRGAVQSVPRAQYEGAVALSLTPRQRMLRVIVIS